jgi:hypothetical protein
MLESMKTFKSLYDAYRFPGFIPRGMLKGLFVDPRARIIRLQRRGKKQSVEPVERSPALSTTEEQGWFGTSHVGTCGFIWKWKFTGWIARTADP